MSNKLATFAPEEEIY